MQNKFFPQRAKVAPIFKVFHASSEFFARNLQPPLTYCPRTRHLPQLLLLYLLFSFFILFTPELERGRILIRAETCSANGERRAWQLELSFQEKKEKKKEKTNSKNCVFVVDEKEDEKRNKKKKKVTRKSIHFQKDDFFSLVSWGGAIHIRISAVIRRRKFFNISILFTLPRAQRNRN